MIVVLLHKRKKRGKPKIISLSGCIFLSLLLLFLLNFFTQDKDYINSKGIAGINISYVRSYPITSIEPPRNDLTRNDKHERNKKNRQIERKKENSQRRQARDRARYQYHLSREEKLKKLREFADQQRKREKKENNGRNTNTNKSSYNKKRSNYNSKTTWTYEKHEKSYDNKDDKNTDTHYHPKEGADNKNINSYTNFRSNNNNNSSSGKNQMEKYNQRDILSELMIKEFKKNLSLVNQIIDTYSSELKRYRRENHTNNNKRKIESKSSRLSSEAEVKALKKEFKKEINKILKKYHPDKHAPKYSGKFNLMTRTLLQKADILFL